jgi:acetolactate synthase I/II/III large subunit
MPGEHRVVDQIVGRLAAIGVGHIFGVDGANIEDLYDAAHFHHRVTAVLAKHEFSAATMADGYSRSGAGLGVVAATSGGGALNLVAGLGESLASRVPVLALVGQAPTTMDGQGSFQDTSGHNGALNAEAVFSAVSLSCERVLTPAAVDAALTRAIAAARTGGPAVLLLPKDIQQGRVGVRGGCVGGHVAQELRPIGNPQPIVGALRNANGPVTIIVGEQAARDNARAEVEALRALLRARVATVPDAKDVAGTPGLGSSSALGVTGVMGHPGVVDAVAASAVCLVVGTRLSVTARTGLDDVLSAVQTVSIGSAPPFVSVCTHVHTEDLRGSLRMLIAALSGSGRPTGLRVPDAVRRTELTPPLHSGPGVRYRDAMAVLDGTLPDGTDVVVDAGNTGASAIHYLPARRGGRFAVALGMGGMGYSFGAGIGMAFGRANTGRPFGRTVVIAGDGAFFMHGMEVHTAVHYRLPVTFVLFNNNAHAMCVTREQLYYDDLYSYNRFRPSRLGTGLAAMFPGLASIDVTDCDEFAAALRAALDIDGPAVVSVECAADEIPPFAPFLNRPAVKTLATKKITTVKENRTDVVASA